MHKKTESKADQVMGTIKENIGKAARSQEMEWKGKMQKMGGRMMEAGEEALENAKEKIAEKANDLLDNIDSRKSSR